MQASDLFHDSTRLREEGVHLIPYGLPDYPRASEVTRLHRQIARGIPMASGDVIEHDRDMVAALANGWLYPELMIPQFRAPRYKSTRAGMAATVSGLMAFTALQTNPFNPRPNAKLAIPTADTNGRVAMPWAPTDRKVDPHNASRMLVQVADRHELNERVLESERHIVGEQSTLAGLIAREGVEEDVLALIVRYETAGLTTSYAATTFDGNSRIAIARDAYRQWIVDQRDEILAVTKSKRPRAALARAIDLMRDGLFPLEHDDPITLRHLRTAVTNVLEERSTDELIDQRLFAIANLFVIPVTMIVAFEATEETATVLDAADQMMRNVHHPSRGPKVWEHAAGHAEIRDEVVGKLHDRGILSLGEALYLGPRYEEASRRHGMPSEPDLRAYAAVDFVNGNHDAAKEARSLVADAIGTPQAGRLLRAQIITAIVSEQVHNLSASTRKTFETTLSDVLNSYRFGTVKLMPADSGDTPADLREEADIAILEGEDANTAPVLTELAIKGAIALAALGHLTRPYGANTLEMPRPYQVIENMVNDPFGRRMLANAIDAWREEEFLPEYDVRKRKPIAGAPPMRPATLAALFPDPDNSITPEETSSEKLTKMRKILSDKFQPLLDELLALPEVRRAGAPADLVTEVLNILGPARTKLELQKAKFEEFHTLDADHEDEELVDEEMDEESTR